MSGNSAHPYVLSAIDVGPVRVQNRIVSTSHQTSLVHHHLPTDDLLAYHEARARGGVGSIFLEATAVDASGLLTAHTIGGFLPEIVPVYQRLGEALRAHGARLFVQLNHGGREQISSAPRAPTGAPSAVPSLRFKCEPRALTLREIHELIDGYATCARHARQGAVDGIEVSVSHGYLPAQFLSAGSNRRADQYAGTLPARLRFALEVLGAVLDAAERLAGAGVAVTLACAAPVPGETLHQYQRNLYLARLDRLAIAVLHHTELAIETGRMALRHVFSGRELPMPAVQTLVLAQGRVPDDQLWAELELHPGAVRAGDVLGPRTLEEAVLEGTRAVTAGAARRADQRAVGTRSGVQSEYRAG